MMSAMTTALPGILFLEPEYRERVWGGQRLRPGHPPVGEAWVAYEGSRVGAGRHAGRTLAELAAGAPDALLGRAVAARFGRRFPLLVKLLDTADWLSVQVHPNDEQAERLVGPGEIGKTEAWHVLDAEPGARILAGTQPGTTREALQAAIRAGHVLDVIPELDVARGDSILLPAGTLHTIGPGLLLYEVQQASDITFRVYDWDRPASPGRRLHVEESVAVADPVGVPLVTRAPALDRTGAVTTVRCPFFDLEVVRVGESPLPGDTQKCSLHVLTVADGAIQLRAGNEHVRLRRFETAVVTGGAGGYGIEPVGGPAMLLRASVPDLPTPEASDSHAVLRVPGPSSPPNGTAARS